MKVRDLMTKNVVSCSPEANLAEVTELMWRTDCGVLPVVAEGRLTGILTDRDICMALGTRNRPASEVTAGEVANSEVQACTPDSDIHAAMGVMRREKVRRLPVVEDGRLQGILALNDIIEAVDRKHGAIDYEEVMGTMKAVCEHRQRQPAGVAA